MAESDVYEHLKSLQDQITAIHGVLESLTQAIQKVDPDAAGAIAGAVASLQTAGEIGWDDLHEAQGAAEDREYAHAVEGLGEAAAEQPAYADGADYVGAVPVEGTVVPPI